MKKNKSEAEEALDYEVKSTKITWVKDEYGRQGEVMNDGKLYWLTRVDKETGKVANIPMTQKEWEDRNQEMSERKRKK